MRAVVFMFIGLLLGGCATDCDAARDKLDSCHGEIYAAHGGAIHPVPVTIGDHCSEDDRCTADCVNAASCEAMAYVLNYVSDPNFPPPPDARSFSDCFERCLDEREK